MKYFQRDRTFAQPLNWTVALFLLLFHVCAIAALFMFSWRALAIAVTLWWVVGSLGIGMGYHRLLTHRGYKCPKWVEYFLTLCGTLALQGGPIGWVATHRLHHQNSDKAGDPHSPLEGGYWSHIGWVITGEGNHNKSTELLPYVPELRKDRFHIWISKWHWVPIAILAVALFAAGGWAFVMWGLFLRTVFGLHATFLVNSATHMWGSRRFVTADRSRNNFLVAMLSWGEGWHNNHHAYPQSARHGLAWYELDVNWLGIALLGKLGLAWDIKLPRKLALEPVHAIPPAELVLKAASPSGR